MKKVQKRNLPFLGGSVSSSADAKREQSSSMSRIAFHASHSTSLKASERRSACEYNLFNASSVASHWVHLFTPFGLAFRCQRRMHRSGLLCARAAIDLREGLSCRIARCSHIRRLHSDHASYSSPWCACCAFAAWPSRCERDMGNPTAL